MAVPGLSPLLDSLRDSLAFSFNLEWNEKTVVVVAIAVVLRVDVFHQLGPAVGNNIFKM